MPVVGPDLSEIGDQLHGYVERVAEIILRVRTLLCDHCSGKKGNSQYNSGLQLHYSSLKGESKCNNHYSIEAYEWYDILLH